MAKIEVDEDHGLPRFFFVGESTQSQKAEIILLEHGIPFVRIQVSDREVDVRPPLLVTEEGRYAGIERIQQYAEAPKG